MEEKMSHITDSKRTKIDLWNGLQGLECSRETRMEVVAWIAVCVFNCRLEGGFIRDWVVGNYRARPTASMKPSEWIEYKNLIPCLNKEVIPCDLDCHLPLHHYFDIEKFLDELHKYKIEAKVFRERWRYVMLLDENYKTGPFTMDLIEPHVALTHDRIDFDVSNLSLEKDYTDKLGMRVDTRPDPYLITLETIVDNIKNKRFRVLRPIDPLVQERIRKMEIRGWTQTGEAISFIPNPPSKYNSVLVRLPPSTNLYQGLLQQMQSIGEHVRVLSIEEIKNQHMESAYLANKAIIAKQCPHSNPNERELFHGTEKEGIDGILNYGYDDRYWNLKGAWGEYMSVSSNSVEHSVKIHLSSAFFTGHGTYFADNPVKSHDYTAPSAIDQSRVLYYNKVILGKQAKMSETNEQMASAPKDYHSVLGTHFGHNEYIVYRYGQVLPYLKITYKC